MPVLIASLLALSTVSGPPACTVPGLPISADQQALMAQTNQYRGHVGVASVRWSKALELAALEHARDMARRDYFEHADPEGRRVGSRTRGAGYCRTTVGENLYWGKNSVRTATAAMDGWKKSPGHDANLKDDRWRYMGAAVYREQRDDGEHIWWVQVFGADARLARVSPRGTHSRASTASHSPNRSR
jgi:uncharacterized protein YkwD